MGESAHGTKRAIERDHYVIRGGIGIEGEVKLINPVTMESIADSVLSEGLATKCEIDNIVADLYELARDSRTVVSLPRVVQTWGYRAR